MTYDEVYELDRYQAFDEIYKRLDNGIDIILTKDNKYDCDNFLNFRTYPEIRIRINNNSVPYMVEFSCDEPLRLEEAPTSFLKSILLNCD